MIISKFEYCEDHNVNIRFTGQVAYSDGRPCKKQHFLI